MKIFSPFTAKNITLKNRIVLPPMCMYASDDTGVVKDFHLAHYGSRALGGAGLIIIEAVGVSPGGRITPKDLGIWSDDHIPGLKKLVDMIHSCGAVAAIQLNHAGRKSTAPQRPLLAPSAVSFSDDYDQPVEMSLSQIAQVINDFADAAKRAEKAGFDAVEIHGAHGYLISEFLSELSNLRQDDYASTSPVGNLFLKEILEAVHDQWPNEKPLWLRVSADDYHSDGMTAQKMADILKPLAALIDLLHVSTGAVVNVPIKPFQGYQLPHSQTLREALHIPTIGVGLIESIAQGEKALQEEKADLIAFGRALLRNPHLPLEEDAGKPSAFVPFSYQRGWK